MPATTISSNENARVTEQEASIPRGDLKALAARIRGAVIRPGDQDYDKARAVWNGRFDRHPALIVQAADTHDVARAVTFARKEGLYPAVRGQAHHPAGFASVDGGLVIDLSHMKKLEIDPLSRTARIQPGLPAGEFFRAINALGMITTIGSHSPVGMAGLTLGGGLGYGLMSKYGLVCDNLLSVEVVTADSKAHTASAVENPDLFWALRGGGGNFGVVTSLTYRLHLIEPTIAGALIHPVSRTGEVLRFWREFIAGIPDNLSITPGVMSGPDGRPMCALIVSYFGPLDEGHRLLEPLRAFGPPIMDTVAVAPYSVLLDLLEIDSPAGDCYAWTTRGLLEISDAAIETIVSFAETRTSPKTSIVIYHCTGLCAGCQSRRPLSRCATCRSSSAFTLAGAPAKTTRHT